MARQLTTQLESGQRPASLPETQTLLATTFPPSTVVAAKG